MGKKGMKFHLFHLQSHPEILKWVNYFSSPKIKLFKEFQVLKVVQRKSLLNDGKN